MDHLTLPTSARYVVRKDEGVYMVRKNKGDLWTFPGGKSAEGRAGFKDFAYTSLYPYFDELKVLSLDLMVSPREKIHVDEECERCSVFLCHVEGKPSEKALGRECLWLAPCNMLVPHVLSPDIRWILPYVETESRLA